MDAIARILRLGPALALRWNDARIAPFTYSRETSLRPTRKARTFASRKSKSPSSFLLFVRKINLTCPARENRRLQRERGPFVVEN